MIEVEGLAVNFWVGRNRVAAVKRGPYSSGMMSTTCAVPPRTAARASFSDSSAMVSLTPCASR